MIGKIFKVVLMGFSAAVALVFIVAVARPQPDQSIVIPQNKAKLFLTKNYKQKQPAKTETAAFAAGCFWGVEEEFRKQPGVVATAVGYTGGHTKNPTYEEVCSDTTGHAESVEVEFDPAVVKYETLVKLFFNLHDSTTVNRQGPDFGSQYRSAVFFYNDTQRVTAQALKLKLQKEEIKDPIVTEIIPASEFYSAEAYHQQYVEKGGRAACHFRFKEGA